MAGHGDHRDAGAGRASGGRSSPVASSGVPGTRPDPGPGRRRRRAAPVPDDAGCRCGPPSTSPIDAEDDRQVVARPADGKGGRGARAVVLDVAHGRADAGDEGIEATRLVTGCDRWPAYPGAHPDDLRPGRVRSRALRAGASGFAPSRAVPWTSSLDAPSASVAEGEALRLGAERSPAARSARFNHASLPVAGETPGTSGFSTSASVRCPRSPPGLVEHRTRCRAARGAFRRSKPMPQAPSPNSRPGPYRAVVLAYEAGLIPAS